MKTEGLDHYQTQADTVHIHYFDNRMRKYKSREDNQKKNLRFIPRATGTSKKQFKTCKKLITDYYSMINKASEGVMFVRHGFASSITAMSRRQHSNLYNEEGNLFKLQDHKSVIVAKVRYHDELTIELSDNARECIKNPRNYNHFDRKIFSDNKQEITHQQRKKFLMLFYKGDQKEAHTLAGQRTQKSKSSFTTEDSAVDDIPQNVLEQEKAINLQQSRSKTSNHNHSRKLEFQHLKTAPRDIAPIHKGDSSASRKLSKKVKYLTNFHSLSQKGCNLLQSESGKSFLLKAMNDILQHMEARISHCFFCSKKRFAAYIAQSFRYEIRNAVAISNDNFWIKTNQLKTKQKQKGQQNSNLPSHHPQSSTVYMDSS
ncbi:MAG: hypothetical protein AB8B66_03430 [Rickettsiaceae bacterium]